MHNKQITKKKFTEINASGDASPKSCQSLEAEEKKICSYLSQK